jgi:ribosomal protein S18 acetylase RimI-like enzyme
VALVTVRPLADQDREWLRGLVTAAWGLPVVTPAEIYHAPESLDGFVAEIDGERAGVVTYAHAGDEVEVVTLNALRPGLGAGRALLEAVRDHAAATGARRVWLITTDDNPNAIGFYGHVGMRRGRMRPRFDETVRAAKPTLPSTVVFDALEFECVLPPVVAEVHEVEQ